MNRSMKDYLIWWALIVFAASIGWGASLLVQWAVAPLPLNAYGEFLVFMVFIGAFWYGVSRVIDHVEVVMKRHKAHQPHHPDCSCPDTTKPCEWLRGRW